MARMLNGQRGTVSAKPRAMRWSPVEPLSTLRLSLRRLAFVVVLPHHAFTLPDATGAYALTGLPRGKYVVKFWHPAFGEQSRTVEVTGKKSVRLDLRF